MSDTATLLPRPKAGEVRVRVGAIGMSQLGLQAVGRIEAIGPETSGFARGDRVAYRPSSARVAASSLVAEGDLIGFPKDVSFDRAAALLPLGLLARTIVKQFVSVSSGQTVRVDTGDTAVDEFVCAWLRDLGAEVVDGTATADVFISAPDLAAARAWRHRHGTAQQVSADVFQAIRRGVFDGLSVTSYSIEEIAQAKADLGARRVNTPVVMLPLELAA